MHRIPVATVVFESTIHKLSYLVHDIGERVNNIFVIKNVDFLCQQKAFARSFIVLCYVKFC